MEADEDWGDISDSELLSIELPQENPSTSARDKSGPSEDVQPKVSPSVSDSPQSKIPSLHFCKKHLSVSLLCQQTWCEMKVVYDFLHPQINQEDKQRTEVQTGARIHLARELEVHDVVPVTVKTHEDSVAVNIINMLHMIPTLEAGQRVREFPVFGVVEGVYLMGVIDELSYNQKGELVLKELKTRRQHSLPSAAQAVGHNFQVGLYKLLFDSLVRGGVKKEHILEHLKLKASQALGAAVVAHAAQVGLKVATFGELVDSFLITMCCSDLPCIDVLQLEYLHQSSKSLIGTVEPSFDEVRLREELRHNLEYWKGQREPKGVDIEEVWKCTYCPYVEVCQWRKDQAQVASNQKTAT